MNRAGGTYPSIDCSIIITLSYLSVFFVAVFVLLLFVWQLNCS